MNRLGLLGPEAMLSLGGLGNTAANMVGRCSTALSAHSPRANMGVKLELSNRVLGVLSAPVDRGLVIV